MSQVQHIFIAPARGAAMQSLGTVEALADTGLAGDRYAKAASRHPLGRPDPTREVTLIESENIEYFFAQTGHRLAMSDPRRNIVTAGIRLNDLCGRRFQIGTATFEGIELCEPCNPLKRRTHPELVRVLHHRGGLRARIVLGGAVSVGDAIHVQPASLRDQSAFAFG
jgi:MOSC domain-containing protein YiiM